MGDFLSVTAVPAGDRKRREVGMDEWAWEQLRSWLEHRSTMPVGALLCVINGPTRGRPWSGPAARTQLRRLALDAGVRRRFAPHQLRHAHAVEMAREGVPLNVIPRQLGHAGTRATPRRSEPGTWGTSWPTGYAQHPVDGESALTVFLT